MVAPRNANNDGLNVHAIGSITARSSLNAKPADNANDTEPFARDSAPGLAALRTYSRVADMGGSQPRANLDIVEPEHQGRTSDSIPRTDQAFLKLAGVPVSDARPPVRTNRANHRKTATITAEPTRVDHALEEIHRRENIIPITSATNSDNGS